MPRGKRYTQLAGNKYASYAASYGVKRATMHLNEIDALIDYYIIKRTKAIAVMERYKIAKKETDFAKAQEAAIEGDQCTDMVKKLTKTKNFLLRKFERTWATYIGSEVEARLLVQYLRFNGDGELTKRATDCDPEDLFRAVAHWKAFCRFSVARSKVRLYNKIRKGAFEKGDKLRTEDWWLDCLTTYEEAMEDDETIPRTVRADSGDDEVDADVMEEL